MNVEARLAINTAKRAVFIGPPLVAIFWAFGGFDGAVASLIGVLLVVGNFLLFGAMLSVSAKISLSLYHAAALFGFFIRLGLITITVLVISQLVEVDRLALGITLVVTYLVLLSWEAVAVAKGQERELEWIS